MNVIFTLGHSFGWSVDNDRRSNVVLGYQIRASIILSANERLSAECRQQMYIDRKACC